MLLTTEELKDMKNIVVLFLCLQTLAVPVCGDCEDFITQSTYGLSMCGYSLATTNSKYTFLSLDTKSMKLGETCFCYIYHQNQGPITINFDVRGYQGSVPAFWVGRHLLDKLGGYHFNVPNNVYVQLAYNKTSSLDTCILVTSKDSRANVNKIFTIQCHRPVQAQQPPSAPTPSPPETAAPTKATTKTTTAVATTADAGSTDDTEQAPPGPKIDEEIDANTGASIEDSKQDDGHVTTGIVIGVLGVVAMLGIVLTLLYIRRRRNQSMTPGNNFSKNDKSPASWSENRDNIFTMMKKLVTKRDPPVKRPQSGSGPDSVDASTGIQEIGYNYIEFACADMSADKGYVYGEISPHESANTEEDGYVDVDEPRNEDKGITAAKDVYVYGDFQQPDNPIEPYINLSHSK